MILHEVLGDFRILRIVTHGHVGRAHDDWHFLCRILGIGSHVFWIRVDRLPLVGTVRTLDQLPLVFEEHAEVVIVPLRRVGRPGAFET